MVVNKFNVLMANLSVRVEGIIKDVKNALENLNLTDEERDIMFQILANLETADESLGEMYRGE